MGGYSFVALNRTSYSGYNLGDDVQGPKAFIRMYPFMIRIAWDI